MFESIQVWMFLSCCWVLDVACHFVLDVPFSLGWKSAWQILFVWVHDFSFSWFKILWVTLSQSKFHFMRAWTYQTKLGCCTTNEVQHHKISSMDIDPGADCSAGNAMRIKIQHTPRNMQNRVNIWRPTDNLSCSPILLICCWKLQHQNSSVNSMQYHYWLELSGKEANDMQTTCNLDITAWIWGFLDYTGTEQVHVCACEATSMTLFFAWHKR